MRRKDREIVAVNEILEIIGRADVLHLGLFDGEYPYVVPLHYGFEYSGGRLVFYMHSAREGHKLDLIKAGCSACVELETGVELIPGGENACSYGASYASVIARGRAQIVTDVQENIKGLKLLMKNQTGQEFEISEKMAAAVAVIRFEALQFTAKSRKQQKHGGDL